MSKKEIEEYEIRCDVLCEYGAADHENRHKNLKNDILEEALSISESEMKRIRDHWHTAIYPRKMLYKFLNNKGLIKSTENLFSEYQARNKDGFRIKNLDTKNYHSIKEQLLCGFDIDDNGRRINEYCFIDEFNIVTPLAGVILNQSILIDFNLREPYFRYFFTFMLERVNSASGFVQYHLTRSFNDDVAEYRKFLIEIVDPKLPNRLKNLVNEWLAQNEYTGFEHINTDLPSRLGNSTNPENKAINNTKCLSKWDFEKSKILKSRLQDEKDREIFKDAIKTFATGRNGNIKKTVLPAVIQAFIDEGVLSTPLKNNNYYNQLFHDLFKLDNSDYVRNISTKHRSLTKEISEFIKKSRM